MPQKGEGTNHGPGRQYFVPAPETTSRPAGKGNGAESGRGAPAGRDVRRAKAPSKPAAGSRPSPAPAKSTGRPDPSKQRDVAPRRRGRRLRRVVLGVVLIVVMVFGFFAYRAFSTFSAIERIDLGGSLTPSSGEATNYLLVGSDSRDELDPEGDSGVVGSRADTMIILRVGPEGSQMMSIPRDLWVTISDTGSQGRINGSFNRGPANLVSTITSNLDIPVDHYVEVSFGSFAGLVDALGGVPIDFEHPAFDKSSGLNVTEPGVHVLNGDQALAFARSRHFVQVIDGREVKDPTGDLGRQQRQQEFLRAALGALGRSKNPLDLLAAGDAMSSELKVDEGLGMMDMYSLARRLGGSSPDTIVLPTAPVRKGKAAVLVLKQPDAEEVLAGFR